MEAEEQGFDYIGMDYRSESQYMSVVFGGPLRYGLFLLKYSSPGSLVLMRRKSRIIMLCIEIYSVFSL